MGLIENVRAANRGYQSGIKSINDAFVKARKAIEDERAKRLSKAADVQGMQDEVDEAKGRGAQLQQVAKDIAGELYQLERRRAELLEKQVLNEQARHEAEDDISEISSDMAAADKDLAVVDARMEELTKEMGRLTEERRQLTAKKDQAIANALVIYCSDSEERIRAIDKSTQREGARQVLESYHRAVEDDPEVAALTEAREEWKSISKAAQSGAVRKSAETELAKAEKALEKRFPGISTAEKAGAMEEDLLEVFYMPQDEEFITFMPLSAASMRLEKDDDDLPARVIYEFADFGVKAFEERHDMCVMVTEAHPGDRVVSLELSGGSVGFLFSPLPKNVREAIENE